MKKSVEPALQRLGMEISAVKWRPAYARIARHAAV